MFNINDILAAAQGGQGINNLAQQFGLSPEQAQAAIQSVIPAFSQGLQNQAATPGGLGSIISTIANGAVHQQSFNNPGVAQSPEAQQMGGNVLGQIFGNSQITGQIAQTAAANAGISPAILQQMMPVIASMIMGGMFHSMQNQGMGGVLGQLAGAASQPGGLGSMLGGATPAQAGGGFMSMLTNMLGGLMGGAQQSASAQGGLQGQAVQMGIDALKNMMQGGVQVQQAHLDNMQSILNQLGPKR